MTPTDKYAELPYRLGGIARVAGVPLIGNPYERESDKGQAWKRGWSDRHFELLNPIDKYAERAREITEPKAAYFYTHLARESVTREISHALEQMDLEARIDELGRLPFRCEIRKAELRARLTELEKQNAE